MKKKDPRSVLLCESRYCITVAQAVIVTYGLLYGEFGILHLINAL